MKKLNLAIIGQGRSGKDIHGKYYISSANIYYNVTYVIDQDEYRREVSKQRYPGCVTLSDYRELFDKKDVDVVINASYSNMHYDITKDLLMHGFNVVVEKPFSKTEKQCQELMDIAKKNNVKVCVFQQTFYAPYYDDILRIVNKDVIGRVLEVSIRYNSLSRRWDWQTLQKRVGGNAYNTGPHPFGCALGILGFDDKAYLAFGRMNHTLMSAGDYDDYVKAIITAPNKPVVDIEINNTDAYSGYTVKIQGTRGTYKTNTVTWNLKYIVDGENPKREPIETFLANAEGNPCYCSEKLITHEEEGKYNGTAFDVGTSRYYEELYYYLTEDRPMYADAIKAMKTIGLIEKIHKMNPIDRKF